MTDLKLITRAQWGARARGNGAVTPFRERGCCLHWEGAGWETPWAHSTCDNKVRAIQADHMDRQGWSDIAYNFLACPHGYVFEGRGLHRRPAANGDYDANTWGYAVQGMWGTRSGKPSADLYTALRDAIDHCRAHGAGTELRGHRDFKATECPGDDIHAWLRRGAPRPTQRSWLDMATEADLRRVVREELTAFLDRPVGKYHNDKTITVRGGLGGGARYAFWALTVLMGLRPIIEAGLTEEEKAEIAEAAASAVPEEIAADVVTELKERL